MKIKAIKNLPRWITIPGLTKKGYRALQEGKTIEAGNDAVDYLVTKGFAEIIEAEKKTKAKAKKGGDE